jgi:hypothetical protein
MGSLSIGEPATVRNLTVFPLLDKEPRTPSYVLLGEALARESVTISEISDSGAVPSVKLVNRGDRPVLLLDGEHLVGCKQNRIVNTTILAPADAETRLPVSCVEHGRWRSQSRHFEASDRTMFAELRAAKTAQVTQSLRRQASHAADQAAIWDGIAAKAARLGSESPSGAMSGIYRRREVDLDAYLRGMAVVPGQRGAIFAINGRVVGLEVLDAGSTWEKCFANVVSGYALDALDHYTGLFPSTPVSAAETFIGRLAEAREARFDGVGLGQDVRFEGEGLVGLALVVDRTAIHLCAFDLADGTKGRTRTGGDRALRRSPAARRGAYGDAY